MPTWRSNLTSKPFQFDLATLLVGTTAWALLLTAMRLLGFPLRGYFFVSVLLLVVGISLILFRKLGRPLSVSVGCGVVVAVIGEMIFQIIQRTPFNIIEPDLVAFGGAYGLFAFFFFEGVFFGARIIRSVLS